MAATKTTKKAAPKVEAKPKVPSNATDVAWPTDRHNVTTALRKAITQAAKRVNTAEDRFQLIQEVLAIGAAHVDARYKENCAGAEKARAAYAERQAARAKRENFNTGAITKRGEVE